MTKLLRFLGALDWFVAGASIVVGLALQNWWVVGAGLLGLVTAYFQPAKHIHALVEKKFVRKRATGTESTAQVQQEEAFYAQFLTQPEEATTPETPVEPRTYASSPMSYRGTFLSKNKHNLLQPSHFNLLSEKATSRYY